MNKRMIAPLIFGLVGIAILINLGLWQLRRLEWKEAILSEIEARIAAAPVALPATASPEADRFLPVMATGRLTPGLRVLSSVKQVGPGYRLIDVLETDDGRRVMVDLGFARLEAGPGGRPEAAQVTGNLHWPNETDSFTPEPDLAKNIWFARDVAAMAAALQTEPLLIVARDIAPPVANTQPLPVTTEGIPNDHLNYAITWFSLAVVWAGMTALLLWRIRRRTV